MKITRIFLDIKNKKKDGDDDDETLTGQFSLPMNKDTVCTQENYVLSIFTIL